MVFLLQQRIVIVEAYLRTGSIKETSIPEKIPRDKSTSKTFHLELGKEMARNRLYRKREKAISPDARSCQ